MDVWSTIERARRLHPEKTAVCDGARRLTWSEVAGRAEALAAFLASRGAARGDRVAVLSWNRLEMLETTYAAAALGAILCPLNARLAPPEIRAVLADAGARWLVAEAVLAPALEQVAAPGIEGLVWIDGGGAAADRPASRVLGAAGAAVGYDEALAAGRRAQPLEPVRAAPGDVAQLYYTSGTTGAPKGVQLTHGNVCVHALCAALELGLCEDDAWAHLAPMFHLADAWATVAVTWVGGRHAMLARFDAEAALELLERERVTITNLIPTMLGRMVHEAGLRRRDLASLRAVLSGGAPIAPSLVRAVVAALRCEYVQTYGMTETSPFLTLSLLKASMRGLSDEEQLAYRAKTGRPMLGVELAVVGEDGRPVAADERTVGEIRVRGPTVTPGYWRNPEATREAFAGGWLRTGDLAIVDREGFVTIVDRLKDVILTGGETVYSTEVEHALAAHPGVLEAAAFGQPDPDWGEIVVAAVALHPGVEASEEDLRGFCRERLAGYKVPRRVHLLGELPRMGSGKIAKRLLRERFGG